MLVLNPIAVGMLKKAFLRKMDALVDAKALNGTTYKHSKEATTAVLFPTSVREPEE